jgi:hypothetical protein
MTMLLEKKEMLLSIPDATWGDFAYRHGRIPIVGEDTQPVLLTDHKPPKEIESRFYWAAGEGALASLVSVTRYRVRGSLSVRHQRPPPEEAQVVCDVDRSADDPTLPSKITFKQVKTGPFPGYVASTPLDYQHTAERTLNEKLRQATCSKLKTAYAPLPSPSGLTEDERIFFGACVYLLIGDGKTGVRDLRSFCEQFPDSPLRMDAEAILAPSKGP